MILLTWTVFWVVVALLVARWIRRSILFVDDVRNLAHAMPYWTIRDGVVVLRDGTYQYGVEVALPATEATAVETLAGIVGGLQRLLNNAVGEGETMRVMVEVAAAGADLVERYGALGRAAPGVVGEWHRRRAQEWRAHCESGGVVTYRTVVLCSHHPSRVAVRKLPLFSPVSPRRFAEHLEEIQIRRDLLLSYCQAAGMEAAPLDDAALMALIWRYWNPQARYVLPAPQPPEENQRVEFPRRVLEEVPEMALPSVRTRAATGGVAVRRDHLWVDGRYARVVSMDRLPSGATAPGMFRELLMALREGWLIIDAEHLPRGVELKRMEVKGRSVYATRFGLGREDPRSSVQSVEVEEALRHAYSTDVRIFRAGVRVVAFEPTESAAARTALQLARTFANTPGITPVNETVALWPALLAAAPCSGIPLHRRSRVFTDNAADFLPLTGPWRGSERPMFLFGHRSGALVPFDPVDPRLPAYNQLVVGSTGSGKTMLANLLTLNLLPTNALVTIVDRGGGYRPLTQLVGGQTVWLGPGTDVAINPMDVAGGQLSRDADGRVHVDEVKIAFLTTLVGMMVAAGGDTPYSKREGNIVAETVRQTYQRLFEESSRGRTILLRDLRNGLTVYQPRMDTPELGAELRRAANDLALRLSDWVDDGVHAALFDRPTSVDLAGDGVLYFDTEGLPADSPVLGVAMALIADVAWRRARRDDVTGKLVVLDEAWTYLRNPVAADFMQEIFRRFRRYGAMALVITQQPDDLINSAIGDVVLNNSHVWYLLRGIYTPAVLDQMGLNDKCRAVLTQLSQVRGQYSEVLVLADFGAGRVGDAVVVRPSSYDYWVATTESTERKTREAAVRNSGGDVARAVRELAKTAPRGLGLGLNGQGASSTSEAGNGQGPTAHAERAAETVMS